MGAEVACGTASHLGSTPTESGSGGVAGSHLHQQRSPSFGGRSREANGRSVPPLGLAGAPGPGQPSLRRAKFDQMLSKDTVELGPLRDLLWQGAPEDDPGPRAQCWQMLLGYLPARRDRQDQGLTKKRNEYEELKRRHYRFDEDSDAFAGGVPETGGSSALSSSAASAATTADGEEAVVMLRQIRVDIPRTAPTALELYKHPRMHRLIERVLYIYSVRHPASGYVQGINDLLTPIIVVLLVAEVKTPVEDLDFNSVPEDVYNRVEAGAYWCLTKMLSDIQDHYTSGQPGIQQMVLKLKDIIRRIDEPLYRHLEDQGLDFLQFSFRWMNCLLMREFPLPCVIRLWDTYIAEAEGFSMFHVYVCAVFLIYWAPQLKQMDFQQLMLFMQKLPTGKWQPDKEIATLLAEAFVLKSLFHQSPKHLVQPDMREGI